jgi:acylphosphatase
MRMHNLLRRKSVVIAVAAISCTLIAIAADPTRSNAAEMNTIAVSGTVTGNVQQVGFRAMIQREAIQHNLAGSAENENDKSVRFIVQGPKAQVDEVLKAIRKGTKKSSDVSVSVSPAQVDSNLKTFTAVGWTSVSRHISHPYDLVFNLRQDNTPINKDEAKKIWLDICRNTVKGDDAGKCDKSGD